MLTAHLDKKLSELIPKDAPLAIAFSGGGDSTALVHALRNYPQTKHVYIVDHNLRAGSDAEAQAAKAFALRCGYAAKVLKWKHNSPRTAIQEKARSARYALMGDECRKDGVEYLLTAHSEDDQAETLMMRYDRNTDWRGAAGIAEKIYAPLWPEMVFVNIVRPLLDVTRQTLRDYNRAHNLTWAEDPSNQNQKFARIRARDYLHSHSNLRADLLETAQEMSSGLNKEKTMLRAQFSQIGRLDAHGIITLSAVPAPELMFHCLRCAGGQDGFMDRSKIRKLLKQMRVDSFKSSTLGGSLVATHKTGFVICRDPVAVKGRQDSHHDRQSTKSRLGFRLSETPRIWDGRFSVTGSRRRSYMGSVYRNMELLLPEQREILKKIPRVARLTLPVSKKENLIRILGHGDLGSRTVISLVRARLEAALGGKLP